MSYRVFFMSGHHLWLSDAPFTRIQPLLPNKVRGVRRVDDRKIISGIVDAIRSGLMWRDAPACCGPPQGALQPFRSLERGRPVRPHLPGVGRRERGDRDGDDQATHLKAPRTAASLLKKGLFRAVSGGPEARRCR